MISVFFFFFLQHQHTHGVGFDHQPLNTIMFNPHQTWRCVCVRLSSEAKDQPPTGSPAQKGILALFIIH